MRKNSGIIKIALKDTLPVMAGYIVLGIGFGMVLKSKGYGFFWALAMSIFIYAGSMQYVAVGLLSGGASFFTSAITTLLVNSRHLFYGISMLEKYKGTGKKKPYLIFALSDETYSLVCNDKEGLTPAEQKTYYFLVSFFDQCYWVVGSLIGSVLGAILPISSKGIDFSLTALFITIVVDQWLKNKHHFPAITGFVAALACLLLFGADNFLIPTMIIIAAVLMAVRKKEEPKYE